MSIHRHRCVRQAGFTIAEFMVAMALGLAVLLAAGSLLIGAMRAHAALLEAAEMDDAGRYALDALARAVHLAGHVDWAAHPVIDPALPAAIAGLDASSLTHAGAGIDAPLPATVNGSDVLALRFAGTGAAPDGDGGTLDCAGFPVHRDQEGWSIFYVARNAQGDAELRCKYRGAGSWSSDAVAGHVDSFQVLYGLDTDGDGAPNRYVNASAIRAFDAALVLAGSTPGERDADLRTRSHWKHVASVRVGLLLHGPRQAPAVGAGLVHWLFGPGYDGALAAADAGVRLAAVDLDRGGEARMRKVYGAVIGVPIAVPIAVPLAVPVAPPSVPPSAPPVAAR
jgi:type IV pilus assembly protein PilW